jgi:hypothetical protein
VEGASDDGTRMGPVGWGRRKSGAACDRQLHYAGDPRSVGSVTAVETPTPHRSPSAVAPRARRCEALGAACFRVRTCADPRPVKEHVMANMVNIPIACHHIQEERYYENPRRTLSF